METLPVLVSALPTAADATVALIDALSSAVPVLFLILKDPDLVAAAPPLLETSASGEIGEEAP